MEFAKEKGIAIYARATNGPLPGPIRQSTAPSFAGTRRDCPASSQEWRVNATCWYWRGMHPHALLAALDEHHVAGKQLHVSTNAAHTTLVISRENLHAEEKVRSAMNKHILEIALRSPTDSAR